MANHRTKTDDGEEIDVEFEYELRGYAGNNWHDPGEGPIIEILFAWTADEMGAAVNLTDAESERITGEICELPIDDIDDAGAEDY